jgi:hypothetical protein
MTDQQNPPIHQTEPPLRDRYLVAAYLLQRYALKNEALDRGHRGEVEALIADGPLDVDAYNQSWSSRPGVYGRNLNRAREWLRSWSPGRSDLEPARNPLAALFGADPRLVDGVDASAAAMAIEVTSTALAAAILGGPSADGDAEPRIVRVRDAAVALARAAMLGSRALGAAEPPSPSSHGSGLDAAVARLVEIVTGFRSDGSSVFLAPADPDESVEQYGRRRHAEARDALIELVRAVAAPVAAGSSAPASPRVAAGSPEERYRKALDAEAFAERAWRSAREAADAARDVLLSARARAATEDQASEEPRIEEFFRRRAELLGLAGTGVSR